MRSIRNLVAAGAATVLALGLAACGSTDSDSSASGSAGSASGDTITLKVGATPAPHAKILQYIQDNLAADAGLNLDIVEYTDYILPNSALNDGEIDANFYQTVPYLETAEAENGYDFTGGEVVSTLSRSQSTRRRSSRWTNCQQVQRSASSMTSPTSLVH